LRNKQHLANQEISYLVLNSQESLSFSQPPASGCHSEPRKNSPKFYTLFP